MYICELEFNNINMQTRIVELYNQKRGSYFNFIS